MHTVPNIVLIGFMGTGKTTVGRLLSTRLSMTFTDMDDVIVQRAGKSIPEIFAQDGEPAFRAMERQVAIDLSALRGLVIATGGGVVLNPDNVRDLGASGLMVALTASADVILERLRHDAGRPLLNNGDKAERIRTLLASRYALYHAIPNRLDTDTLSCETVAEKITALYDRIKG